jgi:hypothetical protein
MSQLLMMFDAAKEAFNLAPSVSGHYNNLLIYLHHGINLKRVDDPTTVVGIANVIYYLNSTQVLKAPKFIPNTRVEWPPANTDNEIRATVRGKGTYQDSTVVYEDVNGDDVLVPDPLDVHYLFSFARKKTTERWLLINAVATP